MNKDTIDFMLIKEPNLSYEQEMKSWMEGMEDDSRWEEDEPPKYHIWFSLIINDEEINHYTEFRELLNFTTSESCYGFFYWYPNNDIDKEVKYPDNEKSSSRFHPFTCSCGVSGCAGIWDGIHMKVRGHTVEWRIKKNAGYNFLPKLFFSFDKSEYFSMLDRLKLSLAEFSKEDVII